MTFLVLTLAIVVAVLGLLVVGLLRSHAEILRALHDNGIMLDPDREPDHTHDDASGTPTINTRPGVPTPRAAEGGRAAGISGTTPAGAAAAIPVAGRDHATLLAFLTSGCSTCEGFWQAFAEGVELPPATRLVVVTRGSDAESPAAVSELASPDVSVVMSTEAWDDYAIPVAPYFVLVDGRNGLVAGEGAAATWERVLTLLGKALADAGYDGESRLTRRDLFTRRPREDRADRELADAGIVPGDPRLYHEELPVQTDDSGSGGA